MASIEKRFGGGKPVWRAHYRTPAGMQRNKTFTRKVDAERFLAGIESSKNAGSFVDPALARVTLADWARTWMDGQAHLSATTSERYAGVIRKHIEPTWASVPLSKVSHADVQAWVTELSRTQSPASVRKIHRVLSLILDMAVKDGRLARNVAAKINLPRPVKAEQRYLTHSQVEDLAHATGYPADANKHSNLDTRTNEMYRLVVLFLAYTGVRFGEMAALKAKRLDLRRGRAVIAESVTPVQGKGLVWGPPKSHRRREVAIPSFLHRGPGRPRRGQGARRPGVRRHPQRPATPSLDVPHRLQRRSRHDRDSRPAPARAAPHRRQPRHRQRCRRQGRPDDARSRLGRHDARHLRTPLRGPPRRGRRRDGRSTRRRARKASQRRGIRCQRSLLPLPNCCQTAPSP